MNLDKYFIKSDLIPAIITDWQTNEVLMLAYMSKESMALTLKTGETWFWSRSRQELWHKGATSGHVQKIHEIYSDCDDDTLLIKVEQVGGIACHTGKRSCFFNKIEFEKEQE
ncbi:MAG: phosphoribosyl-AMP cyclohydrolase [Clostridiales bacterium]|nr:MAG: phosphoribosyl-AMP cyclohydrolase [Clostridiales bacterium]